MSVNMRTHRQLPEVHIVKNISLGISVRPIIATYNSDQWYSIRSSEIAPM